MRVILGMKPYERNEVIAPFRSLAAAIANISRSCSLFDFFHFSNANSRMENITIAIPDIAQNKRFSWFHIVPPFRHQKSPLLKQGLAILIRKLNVLWKIFNYFGVWHWTSAT